MTDEELKIKFFDNLICAYRLSGDTIKAWGENAQLDKVIEECAELIVALQHSKSRTLDVTTVASEVADVLVMSMCAARIIGMDLVADEMNKKLARLKERLDVVKPKVDLEEKYNKVVQHATELESLYYKELTKNEGLLDQIKRLQSAQGAETPSSLNSVSLMKKSAPPKKMKKSNRKPL